MLLAVNSVGNIALQPLSNQVRALPDHAVDRQQSRELVFFHAAALSASPDTAGCIGVAIAHYIPSPLLALQPRRVVFFAPGGGPAIDPFPNAFEDVPEDITYFGGSFWLLTRQENVHRWTLSMLPDGSIQMEDNFRGYFFVDENQYVPEHVRARYPVCSRNEALMVVRLSNSPRGVTSRFRIFKISEIATGKSDACIMRCSWKEILLLDGRIIFLGPGCSRSYEARDFPGIQVGIYFNDDSPRFNRSAVTGSV